MPTLSTNTSNFSNVLHENERTDDFNTASSLPVDKRSPVDLSFINTNARSLRPKIKSLIDCFVNLDLTYAVVTETWFTEGERLELESENLLLGHDLNSFTLSRPPGNAGFSHGGVAIIYKNSDIVARKVDFPNPEAFEVLAVQMTVRGMKRKLFVIAAYLPPNYRVGRAKSCLRFIRNLILSIKTNNKDPYISLAGDFNQWQIEQAVEDYPDIVENSGGYTRKRRTIDRCFSNFANCIAETKVLPPLETEETEAGNLRRSDHNIVLTSARLARLKAPVWKKISFRPFNDSAALKFKEWTMSQDWHEVLGASGSNEKARKFQMALDWDMNEFFPVKTIRRKEDDLPWLNDSALKKIKKKKAVFKDEGRSRRWKAIEKDLDRYLEKQRLKFLDRERKKFLGKDGAKNFFKHVKSFNSAERPKTFDIRDLKPGASDKEVAEDVASFFNQISQEFEPLDPFQIPRTYSRQLPLLSTEQIAEKLRSCKKSSMVDGDIFPALIAPCAAHLAIPLSDIFNTITTTMVWPVEWKKEVVTVIPKKNLPQSYSDLRNISCTKLFSKIYESYVLTWAQEEIELKPNQYGGTKGCSTSHMLISIWDEICDNCEDYRAGTVLTAIDYSKAFNRVSYQQCLKAFQKKGSSSEIIRLLATFLTNRSMVVKVGDARSDPRAVDGGCPQGSILGVFLFIVTTDDLEDDVCPPASIDAPNNIGLVDPDPVNTQLDIEIDRSPPAAGALSSTPLGHERPIDCDISPLGGGKFRVRDLEVVFEPGTRNLPPIEYSDEGFVTPPKETKVGTQVLSEKEIIIAKYIDDNITVEKLNYGNTPVSQIGGKNVKRRVAVRTQNAVRSITKRARDKGMVVNASKTQMLVISDSLSYTPAAYMEGRDGEMIESTDSMKVLGFNFSNKPSMHAHVAAVLKGMRRKFWSLRHLRQVGFNQQELVKIYKTTVRPTADYLDVVYHSLLTDEQDEALENAQLGALRAIFDYKISGRRLRELADTDTLRSRRVQHCDNFARKCLSSSRFRGWFPLTEGRSTRSNQEVYLEKFARCDRLRNSPLHYMRRRLNGKEGKIYGARNNSYREA